MGAVLQEQPASERVKQCRQLARALTLTRQMLGYAEKGEWEQVTECELERRDDMAACIAVATSATDTVLVAEAIAALLHLNEELMAKLKVARTEVMEQGREYVRKRNAVDCYRGFDSGR